MRNASGETAPEMHDRHPWSDLVHRDQFILERRVSIDGLVDSAMERDDLANPSVASSAS
jgi:hypothetical protein